MRASVFFLFLVLMGCKDAIKNEKKLVIAKPDKIDFVVPQVSKSLTVNVKEDLLGYWVGDFRPDLTEDETDSINLNESKVLDESRKRITLSIDEIKGGSIKGHSVVSGTISSFEGTLLETKTDFFIKLTENNNDRTDGVFQLRIEKKDSVVSGKWNVKQADAVKFGKKKLELKKKLFKYDPNIELLLEFIDTDKTKHLVMRDTIDGEEEVYEDDEYFMTTGRIFEKNASKDLLQKDFVANLTKADIFILRNSIFARHGFAFRDKQLRMYFENFDWYMPVFGDVKNELTEVEKKNVELLLRYEQNAVEYYDVFGR
ncbi:YARHG domain-containing protein [Flavobacterium pedocola]